MWARPRSRPPSSLQGAAASGVLPGRRGTSRTAAAARSEDDGRRGRGDRAPLCKARPPGGARSPPCPAEERPEGGCSALIRDGSLKEGMGKFHLIVLRSSTRGTGSLSALGSARPPPVLPAPEGNTPASLSPEERRGEVELRSACDMGPGSLGELLQPWVVLSPAPAGSRSHPQLSGCPRGEMLAFAGACAVYLLNPLPPSPLGCQRMLFPWLCLQKTLTQKEIGVFVPLVLQLACHPAATSPRNTLTTQGHLATKSSRKAANRLPTFWGAGNKLKMSPC